MNFRRTCLATALLAASVSAQAVVTQHDDSPARTPSIRLTFEQRGRFEHRADNAFGRDRDYDAELFRTRLGIIYKPSGWLTLSAMAQDARAPGYGPGAPSSLRDPVDLHEAYAELFPDRDGFGAIAGRKRADLGERRLIASPQWGNVSRTYDQARIYYRSHAGRFEVLLLTPVTVNAGAFNRPRFTDRLWGLYHTFPKVFGEHAADAYILRHDIVGVGAQRVNTFGTRVSGPLSGGWRYSMEAVVQNGTVRPAAHRAAAWISSFSRKWSAGSMPLDVIAEYKYASGTKDPSDLRRHGTFDQLFASNHGLFGQQDLFGWRNIHAIRSVATLALNRRLAANGMFTESWLASEKDAAYNQAGRAIARSLAGTSGRHLGREADVFMTWTVPHLQLGAGYGHFFAGEFIRKTTPGVSPHYAYLFHTYTF